MHRAFEFQIHNQFNSVRSLVCMMFNQRKVFSACQDGSTADECERFDLTTVCRPSRIAR